MTTNSLSRPDWHKKTVEQVFEELGSSSSGLSDKEALRRLEQYGPNTLQEKKKRSALAMFLGQFTDFMILILIAAAVISGAIGEVLDALIILAIVFINAVMGFVQEYRAQKAMEALKKMAAPHAVVIREGETKSIPAAFLVAGDVVAIDAGSVIPADMRLIEVASLKTEEAALTGESIPVEKHIRPIPKDDLPLGDRRNMAYSGTAVSYGRALGIVTATGMHAEIGKIAGMLQEEEEVQTPLQKKLAIFGKKLTLAIISICMIVFVFGLLRKEPPVMMFLTAVSLVVAAIPEALPAVISVSLALGASKMVRQNALIRKLPAVETLGSVTYICSDKTGTLTQNRMTVEEVYIDGKLLKANDIFIQSELGEILLKGFVLNNDSKYHGDEWQGDPTETAFCTFALIHGLDKRKLDEQYKRVAEVPFDSERKRMTTIHEGRLTGWKTGNFFSITKGAVEGLLDQSRFVMASNQVEQDNKQKILEIAENMASRGLRVLGLAARQWDSIPKTTDFSTVEADMMFIGLAGIADPPRDEAKQAVTECREAGIVPVMITGDHPATALNIAARIGIIEPGDCEQAMTGIELEKMSAEDLEKRVEKIRVYARVAPEQKLRIVKALQKRGQFVAMTGDGVNDAPALNKADIGVAMGITGTEVSKEAADMILLDDNFATIVKAVREGRRIFDNIKRFIRYVLTCNSGEIWAIFLAPFLGLPIPLLPTQILWINLVTDVLPGLALATEPAEPDIMRRPPRSPTESLFAGGLGMHIVWVGLLIGFLGLGTQIWAIRSGMHWQTMVFTVLCLSRIGHAIAVRSQTRSLFTMGMRSNMPLLYSVLATILLQMATIYLPWFNTVFHTAPLTMHELVITFGLSAVVFFAVEAEKLIRRHWLV